MNAEAMFSFIPFLIVAFVMTAIGIHQFRSREPVGFYTGEKPPAREELSDVEAWNRRHGAMWIGYGCSILAAWTVGYVLDGEAVAALVTVGIVFGGLVCLIVGHHRLVKRYRR